MIQTPYRKGLAAGEAYRKALEAWRAVPIRERDMDGRPVQPECPYQPKLGSHARASWIEGFRREVNKR